MWLLWGGLHKLVPLPCVLQQTGACGSAQLWDVPQLCPAVGAPTVTLCHLSSLSLLLWVWPGNSTPPNPGVGSRHWHSSCFSTGNAVFDSFQGFFPAVGLISPVGSLSAPGSISAHKAAASSEGHRQQTARLSQRGWFCKAINPLVFPLFIPSALSMHQFLALHSA